MVRNSPLFRGGVDETSRNGAEGILIIGSGRGGQTHVEVSDHPEAAQKMFHAAMFHAAGSNVTR